MSTIYGGHGQPVGLSSSQVGVLADSAGYDEAGRLTGVRHPAGGNLVRRQVYYPWEHVAG